MCTSHFADTVEIAQPSGGCWAVSIVTSAPEPSVRISSTKLLRVVSVVWSEHLRYTATDTGVIISIHAPAEDINEEKQWGKGRVGEDGQEQGRGGMGETC